MDVACPHCELAIALDEEQQREEIVCPSCGSSFKAEPGTTSTWSPSEGQRLLGRFELIDHIGIGAFGTVYKARDPELDRIVAIKVPRAAALASKEDLDRFLREARSAAQLRHPGIVPIFEVGKSDDLPFLVSEYVDGVTLADLSTGRRPAYNEAAELIEAVAQALEYAHAQGVIHRDVKPANIIVGEDGQPRLMDFGLAKRDMGEATMTVAGQVIGTPAYMSPEQASGQAHQVDGRSDVYSLGVILYWLLTRKLPFQGNSRMLIFQVQHDEPSPPRKLDSKIPRDLETICLKAMAKDPNQRYFTAHGLAEDLQRYRDGEPIHARRVTPITRLWRWCRRKPAVAGLCMSLMALAVSVCVLTIFMLGRGDPGPLGIFLTEEFPADRRLEALKELPLNESPTVLEVLKALKRPQDADFVNSAIDSLSNKPVAAGWDPENFEDYARLASLPQIIKLIANLNAGAVDEKLLSAMLEYLNRLNLSNLDDKERAEVLRGLIAILADHPNERIVSRCRAIFDSLDTENLFEWLFKVDSGIDLKEARKLSLIQYTEQASRWRAEEIGEFVQDQIVELATPDVEGFIAATSKLEYCIRAIGEIQRHVTMRFERARDVVHSLLLEPENLDDISIVDTLIESFVFLYDGDESSLETIRQIVRAEYIPSEVREIAAIALGELHDVASISTLQDLAGNVANQSGTLNLRVAAIKAQGILGAYLRNRQDSAEEKKEILDGLRVVVQHAEQEPKDVARAAITAFGTVAEGQEAGDLFKFLWDPNFNVAALEAIQSILIINPDQASEVVDAFLNWYVSDRNLSTDLTVPPRWVFERLDLYAGASPDEIRRAQRAIVAALTKTREDPDERVRELAFEVLSQMPASAGMSNILP